MAQSDLPARGHFPQVKLGKKVPKKAEALLIAAFEGEGGLELPGTDPVSYTHLTLPTILLV